MVTDGSNGLSHGLTFIDGACVHGLRAIGALIANAGLHNKSRHEPSMGPELDNGHRRYSRGCELTNRLHKFSAASRRDSVPFEVRITGMTRASTTAESYDPIEVPRFIEKFVHTLDGSSEDRVLSSLERVD